MRIKLPKMRWPKRLNWKKIPGYGKRVMVGIWDTIQKPYTSRWERLAFYLWLLGIFANLQRLWIPQHSVVGHVLKLIGPFWNVPLVIYSVVTVVRTLREHRKFKRELVAMKLDHQIRMTVLDVLTDLHMNRLSPEQQIAIMMQSPTGPKE